MRFLKPGRLIVYLLIGVLIWRRLAGPIELATPVTIASGQSATSALLPQLTTRQTLRVRWAFRKESALQNIQPGTYPFSGTYSIPQIIDVLIAGPTSRYERITILEGRNSRDIDKLLTDKGLIESGAYRDFITNSSIITRYVERYDFLRQAANERNTLSSLEGYLYPETYMVDPDKNVIDQLVYLQLETFNERIWSVYGESLKTMTMMLQSKGFSFQLSSYGALILASVIEKEERIDANKPLIASIFYNRLETGMRLDADITLCYGFQEPYESCTPARIVQFLTDRNNPYNTRALTGLPPTPISTIHVSSVQALIDAPRTDYFFYLHNPQGKIFPAKTNEEHNLNKSKEL